MICSGMRSEYLIANWPNNQLYIKESPCKYFQLEQRVWIGQSGSTDDYLLDGGGLSEPVSSPSLYSF